MKLFILIVLVFGFSRPVQASSWLKCEFSVNILDVKDNMYTIEIVSSKVIDGHANKGNQCSKEEVLYDVDIKDGSFDKNDTVDLLYQYYDSMTPSGPMSSTEWTVKVPSDGMDDSLTKE